MRKKLCLLLALFILFSGCALGQEDTPGVQFYYLRDSDSFVYGSADGVISFEERDPSGHGYDLRYLLTLYLQGPVDENLQSPFPVGCKLLELSREESEITLLLNANFFTLKDMDLTLACVCIAKTCFSLTDAQSVRIMAESFTGQIAVDQTIHINSLLLEDSHQSSE